MCLVKLFTACVWTLVITQAQGCSVLYCNNTGLCSEPEGLLDLHNDITKGRMPQDLIPSHYSIELRPDIYTGEPPFLFSGTEEIYFSVHTETSVIYLNQQDLNIDSSALSVRVSESSPIQPEDPTWRGFALDNTLHLFALYLDDPLVVGAEYVVTIGFDGTLYDPSIAYGMYWDSYTSSSGEVRYVVATQFQSSGSRRAFPCFDEPAFKSSHNVSLLYREGMTALSNMPLLATEERYFVASYFAPGYARAAFPCFDEPSFKSRFNISLFYKNPLRALSNMPVGRVDEREDGWFSAVFEETVTMSSYLLCFVISDFDYVESTSRSGVQVRIWSRPDAIASAAFANSIAAPMLDWFENYTGIGYPMQKLDHIAIPTKSGAMENWGLVTYGEDYLLVDPDITTTSLKHRVAEVISHEIAHMWFGNLVTCLYWNHTWLNEGFANYFQFQPFDEVLEWDGFQLQIPERLFTVSDADSVNTSLPVRIEAETVDESALSFSTFTYSKGGAMLRMISQMIGGDTLRRGLQRYLDRFAYGNADTDDLWEALNEQILEDGVTDPDGQPIDIKDKMDPWINQRGHPVLTVDRESDPSMISFRQEMFFNPDGQEAGVPSEWDYLWNIPITYISNNSREDGMTTKVWMDREESIDVAENIPDSTEWILLNSLYTGFYRVLYTQSDQIRLTDQLINDYQAIPVENRGLLINDAFQLSRGSYQDEVRAMEFTRYLDQDVSLIPWKAVDRNIGYTTLMLNKYNDTRHLLQDYMLSKINPVYNTIGWEGDDENMFTELLRQVIIKQACSYNNEDCIQQSLSLYGQYQSDILTNPIIPNQRSAVYCSAVKNGDEEDWSFTFQRYQSDMNSPWQNATHERPVLLSAMACTLEEQQMTRYINLTYDPTQIRTTDAQIALSAIAESETGRPLIWQILYNNWRNNPLPEGVNKNSIFTSIIKSFNTVEDYVLLTDFIELYPALDGTETELYNQAIDTVERNIDWMTRNWDSLRLWLMEYGPLDSSV